MIKIKENNNMLYLSLKNNEKTNQPLIINELNDKQITFIKEEIAKINPTLQYDNQLADVEKIYFKVIKPIEKQIYKLKTQ